MNSDCTRVLLVDDQPANLLALEAILEPLGASLVRAMSGEAAVAEAARSDYAVVLMDIRMPGIDGLEAARRIRATPRGATTPIIFVTAGTDEPALLEQAYSLGAVDLLTKPVIPVALRGKVSFFVELCRSREEASSERAFLAAVVEAVADGVVACDANGRLTVFNRAARRFQGHPEDRRTPTGAAPRLRFQRPDGTPLQPHEDPLYRALNGDELRGVRLVIRPDGGGPRTVVVSGKPLADERGDRLGAVVSMHDLTAREEARAARRMSEQLRTANERLSGVFQQAPAFMALMQGPQHVFQMANARLLELMGGRVLQGRPLAQAVPELTTQPYVAWLDEVYRSGEPFVGADVPLHLRRPGGGGLEERFVDFVFLPLREDGADVSGILVHGVDQTARRRAELALRASEERYRSLFEGIDQGFCVAELRFDEAGRAVDFVLLETNPAYEKQTGIDAAPGRSARALFPVLEPHWLEIYGRVAKTGEAARFVNQAKSLGGRWFDVYAARLGDAQSQRIAILFSDITEKKVAEDELRRLADELAEADRRKSEFLAVLAHELRNPMAPLRTGLELMRLAGDRPEVVKPAHAMMQRQLSQLVRLVDDLLDVARINSGKLALQREVVAIQSVVANASETSAAMLRAPRHRFTSEMPAEPLLVDGDPTRLAQVVSNLLNNAAKYTPEGGDIRLRVTRDGNEVAISVQDNGIGIPAEDVGRLFEMFTQVGRGANRRHGGLGIGLSLVRRIVELHGGLVQVASPGSDQGSTFTVRLPLAARADVSQAHAPPQRRESRHALRILVVDDNVDAAQSLSMLLELEGHETTLAASGREALDAASRTRPDVVFLDIGLPDLSGFDVAVALRGTPGGRDACLIALTGWGAEADRARSTAAGFDHHLTKPADPDELNALLTRIGRAAPQAEEPQAR